MTWLVANWRVVLATLAVLAIIAGVIAWDHHERLIGEQKIRQADAQALQQVQAQAAKETQALAQKAAQAAQEASHAQAVLDAYTAQFPVSVVCYPDDRRPDLPQASSHPPGTQPTPARPDASSQVPAGGPARDISAELATIVQSFGRLAILEREWQQRELK